MHGASPLAGQEDQREKLKPVCNGIAEMQMANGVRSPKFIWAPVYSCTHWLRPRIMGMGSSENVEHLHRHAAVSSIADTLS